MNQTINITQLFKAIDSIKNIFTDWLKAIVSFNYSPLFWPVVIILLCVIGVLIWLVFYYREQPEDFEPEIIIKSGAEKQNEIVKSLMAQLEKARIDNSTLDNEVKRLRSLAIIQPHNIKEVSVKDIQEEDSITPFMLDCLKVTSGSFITKEKCYDLYTSYCKRKGLNAVGQVMFGYRFKKHSAKIQSCQRTIGTKRVWCYNNISMVDNT